MKTSAKKPVPKKPAKAELEQQSSRALAKRNRAEAQKLEAEAQKFEAEARKFEADAAIRELERAKAERQRVEELASNRYHHTYRFLGEVNAKTVAECMERLDVWSRLEPGCEVTLIFTSPGGTVVDGMALWDYLQSLKAKGHKLRTHTEGMAASMAGILLQAGDVRSMGREAYLLVHEIQAGVMGSFGEIEDRVKWIELVQDRILNIFAHRMAQVNGRTERAAKAWLKKRWTRTDFWVDSDAALREGLVDEVL